jgi:hypothetical protein
MRQIQVNLAKGLSLRKVGPTWLALTALCLLVIGVAAVYAQSGGGASTLLSTGYDLTWNTVDGGGATFSTGGTYELGGTSGQPDAGRLSGGSYTLAGGFWVGGGGGGEGTGGSKVYLPVVLRNK